MNALEPRNIRCPYCGEHCDIFIDVTDIDQNYIEDCQVCCRPMTFTLSADTQGNFMVSVSTESG